MVLGSTVSGGAEYIITGDKDLLSIGTYKGIRIVTPRIFWEEMQKKE